ncbi:MAG: acyltransferase [Nostoc sp.]|uniref:acyltransferase family protein n=1 Tax=Nostoc sp. TaxID=1180 RepID=UPI002FF9E4A7
MIFSSVQSNLGLAFNHKKNSLGFLRFLFAVLVVLQHSYILGNFGNEPLLSLSKGQLSSGSLAVHSFFIISGFLITRSYISNPNIWRYSWHRILRIFPGFWVCLLVTSFVIAPIAYINVHGNTSGYFLTSDSPFSYVFSNLFLSIKQPDIAGLMASHPEKSFNGSLWTLEWEFFLYIAIAILGSLSILTKFRWIVLAIFLVLLLTYLLDSCHCRIILLYWTSNRVPPLFVLFFSGAVFWLYREKVYWNSIIFVSLVLVTSVAIYLNLYAWVEPLTLPYIILWLSINLPWSNFDKHSDYSYGIYIYSFPIQQLLVQFNLYEFGVGFYFMLSLLLTIPLAILSWHFFEKPALQFKNKNINSINYFLSKVKK